MDYLLALRYEARWFISVTIAILVAGTALIFMLPDVYTARAEIMIQRADPPSSEDGNAVTSGAGTEQHVSFRAHEMIKTTMTDENIAALLKKYQLVEPAASDNNMFEQLKDKIRTLARTLVATIWPAQPDSADTDAVPAADAQRMRAIEQFRDNTELSFDTITAANQVNGIEGTYPLGIIVEHSAPSRRLAYQITRDLTESLLSNNTNAVSKRGGRNLSFLQRQYRAARSDMEQAEEAIASFKDKNAVYLPDIHPVAIAHYQDLKEELIETEDNLRYLSRKRDQAKADLATSSKDAFLYTADGTRILGPEDRLMLLQTELATKASKYNSNHPDLERLRGEIAALRQFIQSQDTAGLESELKEARLQLASKKKRYSAAHPDVRALKSQIAELEQQVADAKRDNTPKSTSSPTNPAYVRLMTRAEGIQDEINQAETRRQQIKQELTETEAQLQRMPYVNRELDTLERKKHLAEVKYDAVEETMIDADMNKQMRIADLLDRLVLLEPATLPVSPSAPKKRLLFAVLFILATSGAYLVTLLVYWYRDKINDNEDLEALVEAPVYLIPHFK